MPRLNGTGPMGQGAGTGRGLGYCFSDSADQVNQAGTVGFGQGLGRRLGWCKLGTNQARANFRSTPLPVDLQSYLQTLKDEIALVKKKLEEEKNSEEPTQDKQS